MKKSDRVKVDKALPMLEENPAYVARLLAVIHRCGSNQTQIEVEQLIHAKKLGQYLSYVNGCFVPV